ncbi:MAG: type II toxin-antitoxin system HicB family antitoxin [Acidobacteria bacterium]|nr:type II toxin-antitoxin system HicB family antitoxin [Acidobacteriota bacterium]
MKYPATLTREGRYVLVDFPNFPNAHTYGFDEEEALARAVSALETVMIMMMDDREDIPAPPARIKGHAVELPALSAAKVELYRAMRAAGIGKAELSRRLNCHLPQIDRLLDLRHASKLSLIEAAFSALGKRLEIHIRDAA